ncbi:PREDICTED: PRA1 family protein 3 isoform X1 [Acromyrmex echinatior]|uniref:PRA1 family protein 3 isoform X1 n=1 Tax=Acromyrmex echinatior TaxID=103372 RepID=UPI000580EDCD|nr:PREDICTED: PRA1 family protein 3 isoform X1 [Acromyrmex echinatior]
MDKTKLVSNDLELPPLRSLDDFLLESARFQLPNLKDLEKWGNRVVNNLLYYQTNYLFTSIVIFLIVGLIHPVKMLVGMLAMMAILGTFAYVSMEGSTIHNFKRQYPVVGIFFIIFAGCFITYTLGSLLVFFLGILLPVCVTFIHASLRLRNIKNRIANKIEGIGLKRTPMGVFLKHLEDVTGMTLRAQTALMQPPH